MFGTSNFSSRTVEKFLLSMCNGDIRCRKLTRRYIKNLSADIAAIYAAGLRDGEAGKPLVSKNELTKNQTDGTELLNAVQDFSYASYCAGHAAGITKAGQSDESA